MLDAEMTIDQNDQERVRHDDPELRERVLSVYFDNTRYLKSAHIHAERTENREEVFSIGDFSIAESCYIQSTGHFNSVEFNICYNQIMYDAVAHAAKYGLLSQFAGWGADGFFARQLPDILITSFQSRFSRPLNSSRFRGEFAIRSVRMQSRGRPFLFLKTTCRFFDDSRGEATGEVDLAILNP
jgi:hypothetical protein